MNRGGGGGGEYELWIEVRTGGGANCGSGGAIECVGIVGYGPNQTIRLVSADLSTRLIETAANVSRGVRRTPHFHPEEGDCPCQRYYSYLMLILLPFNSNPHSNQGVQGLQSYSASIKLVSTLKPECPGLPEFSGKSSQLGTRTHDNFL